MAPDSGRLLVRDIHGRETDASIAWCNRKADVALIHAPVAEGPVLAPASIATLPTDSTSELRLAFVMFGWPRAGDTRESGRLVRNPVQVDGEIKLSEYAASKDRQVRLRPERERFPPLRDTSYWTGMSGAAAWCQGSIVAVQVEQSNSNLPDYLAATPLTAEVLEHADANGVTGTDVVAAAHIPVRPLTVTGSIPPRLSPGSDTADREESPRSGLKTSLSLLVSRMTGRARTSLPVDGPSGRTPPLSPRYQLREHDMRSLSDKLHRAHRVGIVGPGGVGKTQLASAYVEKNHSSHTFVWWIRSGQSEVLAADYDAMAVALGLGSDPLHARLRVSTWLTHNDGWLLVFDDVNEASRLQDFLPATASRGHVIITSRDALRAPAELLELNDWDVTDSVSFLRNQNQGSPQVLHEIAERLHNVPLAIDQAASYMRETRIGAETYLRMLQKNTPDMLEAGRAFNRDESVTATYSLAVERAERTCKGARDLLKLCSLYSGSAIPRQLPRLLDNPRSKHWDIGSRAPYRFRVKVRHELSYNALIAALVQQSLISADDSHLYVHGLVQQTVRSQLSTRQMQHWTYWAVSSLWMEISESSEKDPEDFRRIAQLLLPHILAGADQAKENLPKDWPFNFNWPSLTALRESARALTYIARVLYADDDLSQGYGISVKALDMASESLPFIMGMHNADPIPSLLALGEATEAVAAYALASGQSDPGLPALMRVLDMFDLTSAKRPHRYLPKGAPHFCLRARVVSAAAVTLHEYGPPGQAEEMLDNIFRIDKNYISRDESCRSLLESARDAVEEA
ncbi:NB-ARC domain-containing protein [Streptomyces sp. NPDC085596]|uniref:NB-ARC domain-containing protein n=1 Tax=Streptomyces sp. NPDC085596 TaxID=3365731 RepID=UPI0037CFCD89